MIIKVFIILIIGMASFNSFVEGSIDFNPTQEFIEINFHDKLFAISTNLKKFFDDGNVTKFNELRSKYPSLTVDLRGVNCNKRSLKQINLSNSILTYSNFGGCDLEGAQFKNSYLSRTRFQPTRDSGETNIFNVDFTGAVFKKQKKIELKVDIYYGSDCITLSSLKIYKSFSECSDIMLENDIHEYVKGYGHGSNANFRNIDLSKSIGLNNADIYSKGAKAMALANSDEIFTGIYFDDTFENMEDELRILTADNAFISNLEIKEAFINKKYWVLTGEHYFNESFDVINTDPNVVIILNGFSSTGFLKTVGDVIVCNKKILRSLIVTQIYTDGNTYQCSWKPDGRPNSI